MPRSHGRIQAAIWSDGDFITMRRGAQGMFMFLLSQPDLSHAGLIPMRVNKWAKKAEDLTPRQVRAELDYLAERDFIVVDEDNEEVLIRTFVRNDGVYKQPRVMERMREDARQIESPTLRAAFAAEIQRLPLHELSTEMSGRNADGPSTFEQVERVVVGLIQDFADPSPNPPGNPSERVTDTPHVRAGVSTNHLPPSPFPHPPTTGQLLLSDESDDRDRFEEFWDTYGHKVDRKAAEKKWALALRKPGVTADLLIASAASYVAWERENNDSGRYIMGPAKWLLNERWNDERPARLALVPRGRNSEQQALLDRAMERAVAREQQQGIQ